MHFNIPINRSDIIVLSVLVILFLLGIRIVISFFQSPKAAPSPASMQQTFKNGSRIVIIIDGMMCGMCEIHVKDAIRSALPESRNLMADHSHGTASFTLPQTISRVELEKKLHESMDAQGYRLLDIREKKKKIL